eukprot:14025827-Alexandrium_andersonii.AAC.1
MAVRASEERSSANVSRRSRGGGDGLDHGVKTKAPQEGLDGPAHTNASVHRPGHGRPIWAAVDRHP